MIYSFAAVRSVMSTLLARTDKFNHFGRSDAWNSTHRGRYVFPSLKSAASLSISSLSLCLSPCVVCVVCVLVCVVCVVSLFFVVFEASAMKVNAWTCA